MLSRFGQIWNDVGQNKELMKLCSVPEPFSYIRHDNLTSLTLNWSMFLNIKKKELTTFPQKMQFYQVDLYQLSWVFFWILNWLIVSCHRANKVVVLILHKKKFFQSVSFASSTVYNRKKERRNSACSLTASHGTTRTWLILRWMRDIGKLIAVTSLNIYTPYFIKSCFKLSNIWALQWNFRTSVFGCRQNNENETAHCHQQHHGWPRFYTGKLFTETFKV